MQIKKGTWRQLELYDMFHDDWAGFTQLDGKLVIEQKDENNIDGVIYEFNRQSAEELRDFLNLVLRKWEPKQ